MPESVLLVRARAWGRVVTGPTIALPTSVNFRAAGRAKVADVTSAGEVEAVHAAAASRVVPTRSP